MKTKIANPGVNCLFFFKISKALFTLLFFFFCQVLSAQDKIILKDGDEINAKILELNDTEVKYKETSNMDGPTRTILKSDIFMIKYENGTKEVFKEEATTSTSPGLPPRKVAPAVNPDVDTNFKAPRKQKFGGPRFGVTYITDGTMADELADRGKTQTLTQIGWQFEQRIFSIDNGPTGLVEFVPLIAGLEQGLFLPSANVLIGIRSAGKEALEFGLGPNVSVAGFGMVFAVGINFRSENINFPVNIAFIPSVGKREYNSFTQLHETVQTGHRITILIGFNIRKK